MEEKYLGSSVDGPADIFDRITETPIKKAQDKLDAFNYNLIDYKRPK